MQKYKKFYIVNDISKKVEKKFSVVLTVLLGKFY